MRGRDLAAVLLGAALAACGVKAPPRASGAPDHAPPNDLFRPVEDPNRPATPADSQDPGTPPAPAQEPTR